MMNIINNETSQENNDSDNDIYKSMFLSMLNSDESKRDDEAAELGLYKVWAYNCIRCDYVWLPRSISGHHPANYEEVLFTMEPPKSCAKCKSKYWNKIPQRETNKKK